MAIKRFYLDNVTISPPGSAPTGDDWTYTLDPSYGADENIAFDIVGNTTETSYGYSPVGQPGLAQWTTGFIYVIMEVQTGASKIYCDPVVRRINSSGVVQETKTSTTGELQLNAAQVYQWDYGSLSWSAGSATDRIQVDFPFRNGNHSGTDSITIKTGYGVALGTFLYTPFEEPPAGTTRRALLGVGR